MNWRAMALSIAACAVGPAVARGAEDPAAHQHDHSEPRGEGHAAHGTHAEHTQPPREDEHAHHSETIANEPTESELRHVPLLPPQHPMHDMSNEEMIELMQMDDAAAVGMVLLDQFEWRELDNKDALLWDGQAWYGNDYDKVRLKFEGERIESSDEGRVELLWDRVFSRWWNVQAGVRHDFGAGPSRSWAAVGVQGLAPYWFEVEATAYVGEEGRTAARFSGEYELLMTQRLILQPKIEFNIYGKDDARNGIGSGLSDSEVGLRLRYEIRREFAPYVGVAWTRAYGETADLARAAGHDRDDLQFAVGLRAWF